jgi:phosphoenolpyruvate carboxylase
VEYVRKTPEEHAAAIAAINARINEINEEARELIREINGWEQQIANARERVRALTGAGGYSRDTGFRYSRDTGFRGEAVRVWVDVVAARDFDLMPDAVWASDAPKGVHRLQKATPKRIYVLSSMYNATDVYERESGKMRYGSAQLDVPACLAALDAAKDARRKMN